MKVIEFIAKIRGVNVLVKWILVKFTKGAFNIKYYKVLNKSNDGGL